MTVHMFTFLHMFSFAILQQKFRKDQLVYAFNTRNQKKSHHILHICQALTPLLTHQHSYRGPIDKCVSFIAGEKDHQPVGDAAEGAFTSKGEKSHLDGDDFVDLGDNAIIAELEPER